LKNDFLPTLVLKTYEDHGKVLRITGKYNLRMGRKKQNEDSNILLRTWSFLCKLVYWFSNFSLRSFISYFLIINFISFFYFYFNYFFIFLFEGSKFYIFLILIIWMFLHERNFIWKLQGFFYHLCLNNHDHITPYLGFPLAFSSINIVILSLVSWDNCFILKHNCWFLMHIYPSIVGKYSIYQNKHEKCQNLSRRETVIAIFFLCEINKTDPIKCKSKNLPKRPKTANLNKKIKLVCTMVVWNFITA